MLKRTISSVMSLGSNLNCFLNPVSKKMKKKRKKKDILYNQELTCFTPNKNFQNFYQNKSKINKQQQQHKTYYSTMNIFTVFYYT